MLEVFDRYIIITQLLPLICSGIGFVYGAAKFFNKKTALFLQIVVCALGCLMLGKLYITVTLIAWGSMPQGFNVGCLGSVGCFMFLFSANFGQMDGLVDGHEKEFRKYRLIPLVVPLVIVCFSAVILLSGADTEQKTVGVLTLFTIMPATYYNAKHMIIPDVEFGILDSIRKYNFFALLLSVASAAKICFELLGLKIATCASSVVMSAVCLILMPVLERGAKKWTI